MNVNYIIIGSGIAGITAASNIRKIDKEGNIKIITDEAHPFYSRMRLVEFPSGDVNEDELILKKDEWYTDNKIELILNDAVRDIDPEKKEVITSSGDKHVFDKLLIASGGFSFVPPIEGVDKKGVFTLRTMKDAIAIKEYVGPGKKDIVFIGGGVLGLEVANNLRKSGNNVIVVEFFPRLLPRQTDPEGSELIKHQMENMGFSFYLGAASSEIVGEDHAEALLLKDGRRIDCDMILISAGIRPSAELPTKLGLAIGKGVIVNDRMETELEGIYAAGDLIEHRDRFYGIWPASENQGEVAGINMAGGNATYEGTTLSNRLKVVGIDLFCAGNIDAESEHESIIIKDSDNYVYKKFVIQDNKIIGTILYGDIKHWQRIFKAIETSKDISDIRSELEKGVLDNL